MRIRELLFEDYEDVQKVRQRNGLSIFSPDQWEHFIRKNPFNSNSLPIVHGWILEDEQGSVVGIYGNYPFRYEWNQKSLLAGISHSWAVDEAHRRHSLGLFSSYQRQRNVHFLLNTSANREASRVQEVMKTQRVPVPYFSDILLWILSYPEFIAGALRFKSVPLYRILKYPAAAMLWGWDRVCHVNQLPKTSFKINVLDGFDDRFDYFWNQLRQCPNILRAVRTREALEWHFKFSIIEKRMTIFTAEVQGCMVGYLLLLRQDLLQTGWHRYRIADLQVIDRDPSLLEALTVTAIQYAREQKAHLVEAVGQDAFNRGVLEKLRPHHRQMTNWPAWYREVQAVPGLNFESPETWDLSLYDGDATIWPTSRKTAFI